MDYKSNQEKKDQQRQEIDKAMEAFLAKGGKIRVLPSHKENNQKKTIRLSGPENQFQDYNENSIEEFY